MSLQIISLADVDTPDVERVTTPRALPVFMGMLHAIVGPSEVGKSTLAAHAALNVAAAGFAALVIDGEMSAPTWRRKLTQLGAQPDDIARVHYAEMSDQAADVASVGQAVASVAARLIIWDSALSLISRTCQSENDNAAVGRLFDRLRGIVRAGPAGLIVDHSSKDSANPVSRGASAKFAALDISYGTRLVDGSIPGPLEPWAAIISVEKDRHGILGDRHDREATYVPLGGGYLDVSLADLERGSHRLSADNPVASALARIAALDPPPRSANDAYKRVGGTRAVILNAYKQWSAQGGSGGSSYVVANHRTTSTEPVRTTEPSLLESA